MYNGNFNLHEEAKVTMKVLFFILPYFIVDSQIKSPGTNDERKTKLLNLFFLKINFLSFTALPPVM